MDKVKIIAMYLPQYHQIPENDEFWGEGFTDWVTVRSAKQYYKDIKQPKVPLNDNYYEYGVNYRVSTMFYLMSLIVSFATSLAAFLRSSL